jgi:hypothetical protein
MQTYLVERSIICENCKRELKKGDIIKQDGGKQVCGYCHKKYDKTKTNQNHQRKNRQAYY